MLQAPTLTNQATSTLVSIDQTNQYQYRCRNPFHNKYKHIMKLSVRPIQAKLNKDTDLIGKMDPYCRITLGGQQQTSEVCKSGGKNPKWNDHFNFNLMGDPSLRVEVYDQDKGSDDLVGGGNFNLSQYMNSPCNTTVWVDLVSQKHGTVGSICLGLQIANNQNNGGYTGPNQANYNQMGGGPGYTQYGNPSNNKADYMNPNNQQPYQNPNPHNQGMSNPMNQGQGGWNPNPTGSGW